MAVLGINMKLAINEHMFECFEYVLECFTFEGFCLSTEFNMLLLLLIYFPSNWLFADFYSPQNMISMILQSLADVCWSIFGYKAAIDHWTLYTKEYFAFESNHALFLYYYTHGTMPAN